QWPLTANGKIDRGALAGLEGEEEGGKEEGPRTPVEEILAGIWSGVLKREGRGIGVEENFFELGGHSLLATQVMSRIRGVFGVELALRVLFEGPTIRGLGQRIEEELKQGKGKSEAPAIVAVPRGAGAE